MTILMLTTIPKATGADKNTVFLPSDFENTTPKVKERIELLVKRNIPLTAANLQKIDIPIPSTSEGIRRFALQHVDDLISMSDGQIWLDERLEAAGRRPPLDPAKSLARVGIGADTESRADAPALRRIAEGLRLELSQAANVDGSDSSNATKKQLRKSKALLLAMHQTAGSGGRRLSESCTALLAASKGFLDESVDEGITAGSVEGDGIIRRLLDHVKGAVPTAMEDVDNTKDISEEAMKEIEGAS